MKAFLRSLILIVALCAGCVANAQSLDEYLFSTGVDTNKWINLSSYTDVSVTGSGDSWASSVMNIGFSFPFDEDVYTQYSVNSDGNLRLGSTVTGTSAYSSPFSSSNSNTNCPKINFFGCDCYLVLNTHYIHSQLFGDTLLVVEYCLGPYSSTYRNNQFTWQVHLYASGKIEAVFGDNSGLSSSNTHQMGMCVNSANGWIIDNTGSATHFTSGSTTNWSATSWPAEGTYYTFTRPVITCPRPLSATVSNITATTATISFVPGGTETAWVGTITPGIMGYNTVTVNDTTVNLMMLTPNTEYTVGIRALCGAGDTSTERTVTFRTACVAISAADLPFTEDFEAYGSGSSYGISPCWTKGTSSTTAYPYPYSTAAINGSRGLYFYGYKPSSSTGTLVYSYAALPELTPSLDASSLTLRFNAKRYSSTTVYYRSLIQVGVMTDPTDASTFALVETIDLTHEAASSVHAVEVDLVNYAGTGKYVTFFCPYVDTNTSYSYNYIYIDDVELVATPSCHRPTQVTLGANTIVAASVSWTPYSDSQTTFEVAYGTGTDPDAMTPTTVTGNTAYLTGLTANTEYHVFVRALCSSTDYSEWTPMLTFTTPLVPVTVSVSNPFTDNFEGSSEWQLLNDVNNKWVLGSAEGNTGNSLYISNDNGVSNAYNVGAVQWSYAIKTLILPAGDYTYSFDWKANGESNYDYLRAFLVPTTVSLTGGVSPNGSAPYAFRNETPAGWIALDGGDKLNLATTWQTDTGSFSFTSTINNYNLVFVWANDGSSGSQPPAAIDNVNITMVPPAVSVALTVNDTLMGNVIPAAGSYTYHVGDTINAVAYPNDGYQFDYWVVNMGPITQNVTDNPVSFVLPAIVANMSFNVTAHFSALPYDPCRLSLPLNYGFEASEGFNTTTTAISTTTNPFDSCWRNEETVGTTGRVWGIKSSASYAHTGSQSLMLSDKTSGTKTLLAFPPMNFNSPTGTTVAFWLYRNATGTNMEGFRLYASTTDTITEDAIDLGFYSRNTGAAGPDVVAGTDWYYYEVNVNMIGTGYLLMEGQSFYGNATYVDDIEIYPTPSCVHPNNVVVSNLTPSSVTVSWTAGNPSQNNFVVAYGNGTDPDSMATATAAGTSKVLYDLLPNTAYNVYVKADCGDETSHWTIVQSFHTPCYALPASALPYTEDFDNITTSTTAATGVEPDCWTLAHQDVAMTSSQVPQVYYSSTAAHSGSYSLRLYYRGIYAMPAIDTAIDLLQMSFWIKQTTSNYQLAVGVMSDLSDVSTFVPIDTIINTSTSECQYHEINFNNYTGNGHYIAFRNLCTTSYSYSYNYIDDITIDFIPNCPTPTNVVAEPNSTTSVTVTWSPANSMSNFVVAYGTGSDPDLMPTVNSTTTSAVITGLAPETSYNVYVKLVCSSTEESDWSQLGTVYTGYCQPTPTSVDNQGITNVTFGTGSSVVNNSQSPAGAPYYGNYSNLVGDIDAGSQLDVAITYSTGYTYGTIIWVDWNNNLTFEGSEVVFAGEAPSTRPTVFNASFMVPASTDTGTYRMRIAGADSYYDSYTGSIAAASNANPCPSSSYTIVHDYSLHVNAAPSCAAPTHVVVSNVTAHTATVSWTASDTTVANYRVVYTDEFANADSVSVTGTTANLAGLSDAATYSVAVRAICSATDESSLSSPATFTTLCDAIAVTEAMPFYETFDATSSTVSCWSVAYETGAPMWGLGTVSSSGSYSSYSGYSAYLPGTGSDAVCALISPVLDLTGFDSATVSFVYINPDWSGDQNVLSVKYRNGETDSWTNLATYSSDVTSWTPITLHIPTVSSTLQVGFFGEDDYGYCIGLDSIVVAPAVPSALTVNLYTSDTAMGTTIPAPGTYTFFVGDIMGAIAVPNTGYHFVNWSVNMGGIASSDTNNPIAEVVPFFMAGMTLDVTANFAINQYNLAVVANDSTLGTVTGSGVYTHGALATLTATPATHCRFVQWNDGDTNSVRTVAVTGNATYTATFEAIPQQTVALLVEGQGTVSGSGTYYPGDVVTISATPAEGWEFFCWLEGASSLAFTDSSMIISTDATTNVTIVEGQNVVYTAIFYELPVPATLVINVVEPEMGHVLVNGVEAASYTGFVGDTVVLTAEVADGCQFDGWNFLYGYAFVVTEPVVTYILVAPEDTVTALFSRLPVPAVLTVSADAPDMGMILINGEPVEQYEGFVGDTVVVTAVANEGYQFVSWSFTGNPIYNDTVPGIFEEMTIILAESMTEAIAHFMHLEGIDDVTADDIAIYSENNSIVVRGAEQQTVRIFDVVGRLVAQRSSVNVEEVIAMPSTGIYLVKVGDRPARRVVVRR